jgi:hypothetical protein
MQVSSALPSIQINIKVINNCPSRPIVPIFLPPVSAQRPPLSDYMCIVIIVVYDTKVPCGPFGADCPNGMVCLGAIGICIDQPVTVSVLSSVPPYIHSDIQT